MRFAAILLVCLTGAAGQAAAEPCDHADAIGTARTITVDPAELPRVGTMQYRTSLPLNDHEVVITFDDGPLPHYTDRVLDTLKAHCAHATFFLVGRMARAYPATVRRIYNEGHTIGTHSLSHRFDFNALDDAELHQEVDGGIALVKAALGDPQAISPFFRIPGLARGAHLERFLVARALGVWSADEVADDWIHGVTSAMIVQRAMRRIAAKGHRGVLLLHDINPATAMAVPTLLKELKDDGYKIVHVVAPGERPASVPEPPPDLVARAGWPRLAPQGHAHTTLAARVKAALAGDQHAKQKPKNAGETDYFAAAMSLREAQF
jgi:peptidoglycan/xylan/chitin deacetylase (PgdA/CDA1 family)